VSGGGGEVVEVVDIGGEIGIVGVEIAAFHHVYVVV
jgi:hypothetical protein